MLQAYALWLRSRIVFVPPGSVPLLLKLCGMGQGAILAYIFKITDDAAETAWGSISLGLSTTFLHSMGVPRETKTIFS